MNAKVARIFKSSALISLLTLLFASHSFGGEPVDKLMINGFKRGRPTGAVIDTVVLHFSSNVLTERQNPYNVDSVIGTFANGNVSAHYLVARDGSVYRLVKEGDTSFHAGKGVWLKRTNSLNDSSIGIELLGIGTFEEMKSMIGISKKDYESIPKKHLGFTESQYVALKELLADIRSRHPAIKNDRKHIIGHSDYAPGRKQDPGALFEWSKVGLR